MQTEANAISIELAKELIHEYQKTRNPELYQRISAKFDGWIIYLIRKIEWFTWLRDVDSQDLYGEALIGFHKGILALPQDWMGNKIYLFIGGYIKNELRNRYRNIKTFEVNMEDFKQSNSQVPFSDESTFVERENGHIFHQYESAVKQHKKEKNIIEINLLLNTPNLLTPLEKQYLELTYFKGLDGPQVGKIMGCSRQWVSHELLRITKKLRDYVNKENTELHKTTKEI